MSKEVNYDDNVYELEASRFFVDDQTGECQLMSVAFQKCNTKKGIQYKAILRVRCDDQRIRRTSVWPHDFASPEDLALLQQKPVKDILIAFGEYTHEVEKEDGTVETVTDYGKKWTMWFDGENWHSFSEGSVPFEASDLAEENNEDN